MKCRCITSVEELDDLRDDWEQLRLRSGSSIYTSCTFTRIWLSSYLSHLEPRVLVAMEGRELVGVLPLALHRHEAMRMAIRTVKLAGNNLVEVGMGSLGPVLEAGRRDAMDSLVGGLKRIDWDILQVRDMSPGPQTDMLIDRIREGWEWQDYPSTPNIMVHFPKTGDIAGQFNKNMRENIAYWMRRLEREGRMGLRWARGEEEVERAVGTYIEQHIARWATKGGSYFRRPENARYLMELAKRTVTKEGTGHLLELLIDEQVAGQYLGFYDGEVVRGYRVGMDDRLGSCSPGILVTYHVMLRAREDGKRLLDMGRGDEAYKYRFGGEEQRLGAVQAQQGKLQVLSQAYRLTHAETLDRRLGLRARMIKGMYR